MYLQGDGVPQDHARALSYFEKASGMGDADATCSLGSMYLQGDGVPQDHARALSLLEHAQRMKDANSFGEGTKWGCFQLIPHTENARQISPQDAEREVRLQRAKQRENITERLSRMAQQDPLASTVTTACQPIALPLTSHSRYVEDALLQSSLAQALVDKHVNVKPEWAGGAKILAEGFGPGDAWEFRS